MRWFMSYVQHYSRGAVAYGSHVYEGVEHPVEMVNRWNASYGKRDGFTAVLFNFTPVSETCPLMDVLTTPT